MSLLQIIGLLGVAFGVVLVAAGRGKGLAVADPDRPPLTLPDPVDADAVDGLRFSLGVRGYRMDEVDLALQAIRARLIEQDMEIQRLRSQLEQESR